MRLRTVRRLLTAAVFAPCFVFCISSATSAGKVPSEVTVVHRPPEAGWGMAETDNFLIYHHHTRDFIDKAARAAEKARAAALKRWFGDTDEAWPTRCVLYFYANAREYQEMTGAPGASPAHTQVGGEGHALSRSIHLHGNNAELVRAILPHEVTHAVLAGHFGHHVPRWADEGMAVLNEPRDRIAAHLRDLPRWREDRQLFALHDLVAMQDYPSPRQMGAFYSQSVSLTEFLSKEKGTQMFSRFVREGQQRGYDAALKHCYGWDFDELEERWEKYAFTDDGSEK
jgi:hypothetical protein